MVPLAHLWLPIVVSAVLVFIASSIMHVVLKYHNADYRALPGEAEVRAVLNASRTGPGQYVVPYCADFKDMRTPEMTQKFAEGPVGLIILRSPGTMRMGPSLVRWFIYLLIVSFFIAYVASHVLAPGTPYLAVFRVVGAIGFLAYAAARAQGAIWRGEPWGATIRDMIDGLIFGLLTAGAFGWLWPAA